MNKNPSRPRDINKLGKLIVELATGQKPAPKKSSTPKPKPKKAAKPTTKAKPAPRG